MSCLVSFIASYKTISLVNINALPGESPRFKDRYDCNDRKSKKAGRKVDNSEVSSQRSRF